MSFYFVDEHQLDYYVLGVKLDNLIDKAGKPFNKSIGKNIQKNKETCSICLSKFKKGKSCLELNCKHIYHTKCIEDWYDTCLFWNIIPKCPLCKTVINIKT